MTWLKIPDYDYEVNEQGEVRRMPTFLCNYGGKDRYAIEHILKPKKGRYYEICMGGQKWTFTGPQLLDMARGKTTPAEIYAEKDKVSRPANRAEMCARYVKEIVERYEGLAKEE